MGVNSSRAIKLRASNGADITELEKQLNPGHHYSVSVACDDRKTKPLQAGCRKRWSEKENETSPHFISWLLAANERGLL